jgi:hypothetical protein
MMFIAEEATREAENCGVDASRTRCAAGSDGVAIPAACRAAPARGVRRSRWGHIANPGWNDAGAQKLRAELTERLARAMLASADESPYPTALA